VATIAAVYAPTARNPAWPKESWFVYPERRLSPIATIALTTMRLARKTK